MFIRSPLLLASSLAVVTLLASAGCKPEPVEPPDSTSGTGGGNGDGGASPAIPGPPGSENCTDTIIECDDDTSAEIELRAFIPSTLPGANPPAGPWQEPFLEGLPVPLKICEFYGNDRDFTSAANAPSKLTNHVSIPALPVDACTGSAEGNAFCHPSRRRCPDGDGWTQEEKEAPAEILAKEMQCADDKRLLAHQQSKAHSPWIWVAPEIYGRVRVESWTTADDKDPGVRTQNYSIDISHTPFPSHELVVSACGQRKLLCTYAAHDAGPTHFNLGAPNADGVKSHVTLKVKAKSHPVLKGTGTYLRQGKTGTAATELLETVSYYATATSEGDGDHGELTGAATWSVSWVEAVLNPICTVLLKTNPSPTTGTIALKGKWHKNPDGTVKVELDPMAPQDLTLVAATSCFYGTKQQLKFDVLDCTKQAGTFSEGKADMSKNLGTDATITTNQLDCHLSFKP